MSNQQTFRATTIHPGTGTRVEIRTADHTIIADEPVALGGTNTGANPVELVLGALGACQSVVAQVYAEKFGIKYDELRIELEGDIDLDGFFDKSSARPGYSDIRYKFIFKTDESPEKIKEFLDYVESRCPVGDTLAQAVNLKRAAVEIEAPAAVA